MLGAIPHDGRAYPCLYLSKRTVLLESLEVDSLIEPRCGPEHDKDKVFQSYQLIP